MPPNTESINARLGPLNYEKEAQDYETVISLDDFEGIVEEDLEIEGQEENNEGALLDLLDLNTLGVQGCNTEETTTTRWTLTQEIKSDAWEFDVRWKTINEEKKRNGVLLRRMAMNIVKLCHEQVGQPKCEAEYARYLHLRSFYISNASGKSRKSSRTIALKTVVKRIDPYENCML
jgi:hypothetical protein